MSDFPEARSRSAQAIRSAVAAAAAQRRRWESSEQLWRVAPAAATGSLIAVVIARLAGAPILVPLMAVLGVLIGLAVYVLVRRRAHAVSEGLAARLDAEGGYAGELRSAFWFASQGKGGEAAGEDSDHRVRSEWTEFHVDRAAARLREADWRERYPAVRARRARMATAGLLAAAIVVALGTPERGSVRAGVTSGADTRPAAASEFRLEMLPPDVLKQIEELLADAERGNATAATRDKAIELSAMFTALESDLDVEKLKELAAAMDPGERGQIQEAANALAQLADRAVKAADVEDMPADIRQALEDLGMQLARAAEAEQQAANQEASQMPPMAAQDAAATTASAEGPSSLDLASIQMSKDSDAAPGAGLMMLAPQLGSGGTPSSGVGGSGNSGPMTTGPVMDAANLAEALRHELVEASADTAGENVLSETRRQTERGEATVGFTGTAPRASGRSRASAPPPVPEDRRGTVQTYFTRHP